MFAKLKKKIEEAEGTDLQKLASSMSSHIEKRLSLTSLKSTENLASQSTFSKGSTLSLAGSSRATSPTRNLEETLKNEAELQQRFKEKEEQWKETLLETEKKWKARVAALQLEKEEFFKEKATHKIILEERNREISELKEKCGKLENDVKELRDKNREVLETNNKLQTELDSCEKTRAKANEENEKLLREKDEQIQTLTKKLNEISKNTESRSENSAMLVKLESDNGSLLLRNAELSQQLSMKHHEFQRSDQQLFQVSEELNSVRKENSQLQAEVAEKNQALKLLQQRISDMKKTLQKEMKSGAFGSSSAETAAQEDPLTAAAPRCIEDVNVTYLKHVILKFLTSRECEAQHLTRAVATLLKFSPDEEKLLKETLEWKMSWFGSRPDLGRGQNALYIPPFQ